MNVNREPRHNGLTEGFKSKMTELSGAVIGLLFTCTTEAPCDLASDFVQRILSMYSNVHRFDPSSSVQQKMYREKLKNGQFQIIYGHASRNPTVPISKK